MIRRAEVLRTPRKSMAVREALSYRWLVYSVSHLIATRILGVREEVDVLAQIHQISCAHVHKLTSAK